MEHLPFEIQEIIYNEYIKKYSQNIIYIIYLFGKSFFNYIKQKKSTCLNVIRSGHVELFKWLVDKGCSINWLECNRRAVGIMEQWTSCKMAVYKYNYEALRWLRSHKCHWDKSSDKKIRIVIHDYVSNVHINEVNTTAIYTSANTLFNFMLMGDCFHIFELLDNLYLTKYNLNNTDEDDNNNMDSIYNQYNQNNISYCDILNPPNLPLVPQPYYYHRYTHKPVLVAIEGFNLNYVEYPGRKSELFSRANINEETSKQITTEIMPELIDTIKSQNKSKNEKTIIKITIYHNRSHD